MQTATAQSHLEDQILTHNSQCASLESDLRSLQSKITLRGDLDHASVAEQLDLLNQLAQFPLGQFLIQNRGLNGYWIDYIINEPKRVSDKKSLSSLERFILFEAPIMQATQERYRIFQQEIKRNIQSNTALASCPSGIMRDILTAEESFPAGVRLYGIDIDEASLSEARQATNQLPNPPRSFFIQGDAWNFTLPEPVDFMSSNGLNIYVSDDQRVEELYRQFFCVLKPGGVMLTSIITPPSDWKMDLVHPEVARLQQILFDDIIEVTWRNYRSEEKTRQQLQSVGFVNVTFLHDQCHMYPSVIAYRPE